MAGKRAEPALKPGRVLELGFGVARRDVARVTELLFEAGAGAVEERDGPTLVVYVTGEDEAARLTGAARAAARGQLEITERELDPSWQTEWMRWLGPEAITDRIVLQPTTSSDKLARGKRRIWYEPDQAFGVGSHPTTRLAAQATELACQSRRPAAVLDVGTGNGVLALVAAKLGARRVLGIDVDATAVKAARKNARLNRLSQRCAFSTRPLASVRGRFDLVLANIEVWVLADLAADLARVTAPEGRLVLSGLLSERGREILARFEELGLRELSRAEADGWLGLMLARPTG